MINRGLLTPTTAPTGVNPVGQSSSGGSLLGRRGPTAPPITMDNYGAWQAPVPDATPYTPVDNNPTGSLLRRMGPGDTPHITPEMQQAAQVANAGGNNVAGGGFTKVGQGQGTFGQEQRRRMNRGPRSGLSVTPEMLKRAASQRLG